MTDKELLKYAAYCCGIEKKGYVESTTGIRSPWGIYTSFPDNPDVLYLWNPLQSERDCFRMMFDCTHEIKEYLDKEPPSPTRYNDIEKYMRDCTKLVAETGSLLMSLASFQKQNPPQIR